MPHMAKQFKPFELQFHTVLAIAFVHLRPSQIHDLAASQLQELTRFLSSSAVAIDKICAQILLICSNYVMRIFLKHLRVKSATTMFNSVTSISKQA